MAQAEKSAESSTSESGGSGPLRIGPGAALFTLAVLGVVISTPLAFRQKPHPDPYQPRAVGSLDWFFHPHEVNAFRRLPRIEGPLNDVFVLRGTEKVWVAGGGGLILHSPDGGRSWEQQNPRTGGGAEDATGAEAAFRLPRLVGEAHAEEAAVQGPPPEEETGEPPSNPPPPPSEAPPPPDDPPVPEPAEPEPPPDPLAADLGSVFFADARHGWAVGERGAILATNDGGTSWNPQESGTARDLLDVHFADADHGWVVGENVTILRTTNGGAAWEPSGPARSRRLLRGPLESVHFVDRDRGWVVGSDELILETTDGGNRWSVGPSFSRYRFYDVYFADAEHGWISLGFGSSDSGGGVRMTTDGGKSWENGKAKFASGVHRLFFLDAVRGWALCEDGSIHATTDGGATWEPVSEARDPAPTDLAYFGEDRGIAVGILLAETNDGGASWRRTSARWLLDASFIDASTGWVVGDSGTILSTTDGGESWTPSNDPEFGHLMGAAFLDENRGWVVGMDGIVLSTKDGGTAWEARREPEGASDRPDFSSVVFVDARDGWIVGSGDATLRTRDGGETWASTAIERSLFSIPSAQQDVPLAEVDFGDAVTGIAVGPLGMIRSQDGGDTWQGGDEGAPLSSVEMLDDRRAWAVGAGGRILSTEDAGRRWRDTQSGVSDDLLRIRFIDSSRGWIAGEAGTLLQTRDAGRSWEPVSIPSSFSLYDVVFPNPTHGWVVGAAGTILRTRDAGETWTEPAYHRYPAPWYWIACLFSVGLAITALRVREDPAEPVEGIPEMAASDRPIGWGDPDPLDFRPIALGLSRFLRNESTEPPLTVAITGEWGTGKSSLMGLLREDLQRHGLRPVWFNAWHHQKGENLLASLFANIQRQALPGLFNRGGVRFRSQLLWLRSRRRSILLVSLVALAAAAMTYFGEDVSRVRRIAALITSTANTEAQVQGTGSLLLLLGGVFLPVITIFRSLRAFGLDPAKLMTAVSGAVRVRGVAVDPGARHQFAREFADVTRALRPRTMVIFIDDLDRCSKDNVVEILEAVNFLASSGDCYVVLGMAREWVETCVALSFKELAAESAVGGEESDEGRRHRLAFARNYLEKLINIEVPVPKTGGEGSLALIAPDTAPPPSQSTREVLRGALAQTYRAALPWAALVALLAGGATLGSWVPGLEPAVPGKESAKTDEGGAQIRFASGPAELVLPLSRSEASDEGDDAVIVIGEIPIRGERAEVLLGVPDPPVGPDAAGVPVVPLGSEEVTLSLRFPDRNPTGSTTSGTPPAPDPTPDRASSDGGRDARFAGGASSTAWMERLLFGFALAVLVAVFVLWLIRREPVVERDSPDFKRALRIWHSWVTARKHTPRTIKRFVNRVRYLAMRYRDEGDDATERWWHRIPFLRPEIEAAEDPGIPEPSIVALSAIHQFKADWVTDDGKYRRIMAGEEDSVFQSDLREEMAPEQAASANADSEKTGAHAVLPEELTAQSKARELREALEQHRQTFPASWPIHETIRKRFLDVMQDVVTN